MNFLIKTDLDSERIRNEEKTSYATRKTLRILIFRFKSDILLIQQSLPPLELQFNPRQNFDQ